MDKIHSINCKEWIFFYNSGIDCMMFHQIFVALVLYDHKQMQAQIYTVLSYVNLVQFVFPVYGFYHRLILVQIQNRHKVFFVVVQELYLINTFQILNVKSFLCVHSFTLIVKFNVFVI